MNNLQIFNYKDKEVRTIEKNGEPWWVLKDVCDILAIKNVTQISQRLDDDERSMFNIGRQGEVNIINESGLYNVILRSDKPEAKPFRKWITSEVLPSIRKTGSYSVHKPDKALEIKELNAKTRYANMFLKLSNVDTLSKEYKNILVAKAAEILAGEQILPLPKGQPKTYSATEIGKILGVSANKIGKLGNQYGLKTDEYGEWYRSKSQNSTKEVDTFVYNENAVSKFRELLSKC